VVTTDPVIDPARCAVLALHWQVNVIKPEGFFGAMLAEPVARSGVLARAVRFHDAARAAGLPVLFTRFTVPVGGGQLVTNTAFMAAVGAAQEAFRPAGAGSALVPEMRAQAEPGKVFENQKLSGLAGNDLPRRLAEHGIDMVLVTGGRHEPHGRADCPACDRPRSDRVRGRRLRRRRDRGGPCGVAGQPRPGHGRLPIR
jgi:nicotinamidase-related amidase